MRRFVLSLTFCYFFLVYFSPFSIAITALGEKMANLGAFRTLVRFAHVLFCLFLPPCCLGKAAVCDCGTLWNFLLPFILVCKFKEIYACNDFSTQFCKIIFRFIMIGYNINVIRQIACMVVDPLWLHASGSDHRLCDGSGLDFK